MRIGALEAGGTKMVCAVGDENGVIYEEIRIPTTEYDKTMEAIVSFFSERKVDCIGVGMFGPLCLDTESEQYGYVTSTPKPGWAYRNVMGFMKERLNVPIGIDTDVNAALLGECTFGASKNLRNVIYVTIGTGIGAGILSEGNIVHGNLHPEAGHILIGKHPKDLFEGICPYHKNCFEGLASGPALKARFANFPEKIPDSDPFWNIEAHYIATALLNYIMILAPEKIILGGGVMARIGLFEKVCTNLKQLAGNYINTEFMRHPEQFVLPASLNGRQGVMGCLVLGMKSLE